MRGVDQAELLGSHYRRLDRASHQDPNDTVFVQRVESKLLGTTQVAAVVRSAKVSALVVTTEKKQDLTEFVATDARCRKIVLNYFACQFEQTTHAIDVVTCNKFAILYSGDSAASRAHTRICDVPKQDGGVTKQPLNIDQSAKPRRWLETKPTVILGMATGALLLLLAVLGVRRARRQLK